MANRVDTGGGATLTISTFTNNHSIVSMSLGSISVESLDVSTLSSTGWKKSIAADLKETPEISVEVLFDSSENLPTVGSTALFTVTFPLLTGTATTGGTAATFAGTGYFMSTELPELINDTIQRSTWTIKLDGGGTVATNVPTFTKGTAAS